MQRLDGTPLGAARPVIAERGLDRDKLARELLGSLLAQIMLYGVFHADPHPGNVLVLADGRLGLLDFGSVGRLDGSVRSALGRLLLAMDRGDPLAASDALLEVMLRPDEVDQQRLERDLGQFMARYLSPGANPDVRMFSDLFRIVTDYGLSVPPEVAAVLLNQVLLTILAATAGIMAVLLLGTVGGPSVTTTVSLYQLLGYNLLVVSAILALRVLVLIFRPDR
jgi:ubiquinone biosynthesis protein